MSIVTDNALKAALNVVAGSMSNLRGRNLLLGTSNQWISTAANDTYYDLADTISEGETVTFSADIEPGSGRNEIDLYNTDYRVAMASRTPANGFVKGKLVITFIWKVTSNGVTVSNNKLMIRQRPLNSSTLTRLKNVKLERGGLATAWCRADEDYDNTLTELKNAVAALQEQNHDAVAYFDEAPTFSPSTGTSILTGEPTGDFKVVYFSGYKRMFAYVPTKEMLTTGYQAGHPLYNRWPGCESCGTPGVTSSPKVNTGGMIIEPTRLYVNRLTGVAYCMIDGNLLESITTE